ITIQIQKELDAFNDYPLGAFDGIYSYIYLCSNIYIDTNDKYFIVEAMKYIRDSFDKIKKDSLNDFISGNAGVLVILINLYSNITDNVYKEDILKGIELSVAR
ncbi:lanthionine synthetase LanC family protein, partial [Vibrio cholerae]